jgi:hypothetical protein
VCDLGDVQRLEDDEQAGAAQGERLRDAPPDQALRVLLECLVLLADQQLREPWLELGDHG